MARPNSGTPKSSFGIAEWYGQNFQSLSEGCRVSLVSNKPKQDCPFLSQCPKLAPKSGVSCNKENGVCSLRSLSKGHHGVEMGPITATCPNRFLEDGLILKEIGTEVLRTTNPSVAKEIPFLKRKLPSSSDRSQKHEDVGRIDLVCVNPIERDWCAVEMQAVYFSGARIGADIKRIGLDPAADIPFPSGNRRPDFRSSGPKRLMPQLQIKVPTLRRWGKKMVVVVDQPFFDSLGGMDHVEDISNADIMWLVLEFFDRPNAHGRRIGVREKRYTTLERAVDGLTAGQPATLREFEKNLFKKIK
jgi:hypothetical protein